MSKQNGLAPILIVIFIALAVGGYFLYQKQPKPLSQSQSSPSPIVSDETTNWKTHTDFKFTQ